MHSSVTPLPDASLLINLIDSGAAVLVAYDCAKNYEPALRHGHGAHWALLVGYLYVDMDAKDIRPAADVVVKDEDAFYVFAYHGKKASIWGCGLTPAFGRARSI
ncbi:hypothetical protein OSTOST_09769 [Ostertagia ostertagi]